jgi:hypothetical protein
MYIVSCNTHNNPPNWNPHPHFTIDFTNLGGPKELGHLPKKPSKKAEVRIEAVSYCNACIIYLFTCSLPIFST